MGKKSVGAILQYCLRLNCWEKNVPLEHHLPSTTTNNKTYAPASMLAHNDKHDSRKSIIPKAVLDPTGVPVTGGPPINLKYY